MSEQKIPIPAMLYNSAVGGHVTNSQQIIDENLNREQNDINQETVGTVPYNSTTPNGMGRIVLKKTDNFKTVVEAQTDGNTIFVIKYDFTLTGDVTVPANCILQFEGGSIANGTINFNNAKIVSSNYCFKNITFSNLPYINAVWFGINKESNDISANFNQLFNNLIGAGRITVEFKENEYHTTSTLVVGTKNGVQSAINIIGSPTFICDTENITCIELNRLQNSTIDVSVGKTGIGLWRNAQSIGILIHNSINCVYNIKNVSKFTYGVICEAEGNDDITGQSFNNTYNYALATNCLSALVINSKGTRGWQNGNVVNGQIWNPHHTGMWDATDAPERWSVISGKCVAGGYGANAWTFNYLDIEAHDKFEVHGESGTFLNFNSDGGRWVGFKFNNVRVELTSDEFTPFVLKNCEAFNIDINTYVLSLGVKLYPKDENGNYITNKNICNLAAPSNDRVIFEYDSKNPKWQNELLFKTPHKRKMFAGSCLIGFDYAYPMPNVFGNGTYDFYYKPFIGVPIKVAKNTTLKVTTNKRISALLFDKTFTKILIANTDIDADYVVDRGDARFEYINTRNTAETLVIKTNNFDGIIGVVSSESAQHYTDDYKFSIYVDNDESYVCNPYGNLPNVYTDTEPINSLRGFFKVGYIYNDSNLMKEYHILKGGSVGTIGAITCTVAANSKEAICTGDISTLVEGDFVTINSIDCVIQFIDTTTNTLYLDKVVGAVTDAPIALTAPLYEISPSS